jgi:hypothetical protein
MGVTDSNVARVFKIPLSGILGARSSRNASNLDGREMALCAEGSRIRWLSVSIPPCILPHLACTPIPALARVP